MKPINTWNSLAKNAGLFGVTLLLLSSCGIGKQSGAKYALTGLAGSNASANAYSTTVYPFARTNCVACHGDSQTPKFANANVIAAYNAALTVVSFGSPELSTMVRKVKDGHCGGACNTDGTKLLGLINDWKAASIAAGGAGGGEDISLGSVITAAISVPAPNASACKSPADLECTSDGIMPDGMGGSKACSNVCWTKLKFPASKMKGLNGAANTAGASKVIRSWFEIDIAYENYSTDAGPASYVMRNPRVITPDGPIYVFDAKLWLNGNYRPELGGAYQKIDTVVDKSLFNGTCSIPAYPAPLDPFNIGAGCLPASAPLFSTAASAAGIIQEKTTLADPDQVAFSFEYYREGTAGDCNDLDFFMANVYAPIQRQAVACLNCHKTGGQVSEAGQRFNMDITDASNGATDNDRKKAVCKKFLQRSNYSTPDSSPIITQPTQGLNGMPAQPNFASFAPDWKAWIEREKSLAH